jgi:uncharacterized membrane protein
MIDVLLNNPEVKTTNGEKIRVASGTDKPIKSIMKSISWRIVGTFDTMLISYIITGKVTVAVSIGSVEVLTKTVLYYFHERLWIHINKIKLKLWKEKDEMRDKEYSNRERYKINSDNERFEIKRVKPRAIG